VCGKSPHHKKIHIAIDQANKNSEQPLLFRNSKNSKSLAIQ